MSQTHHTHVATVGGQPDQVDHATVTGAAELLRALANPARIRIIEALLLDDRCVHQLVDLVGIPQPTVSQHLKVLRAARLVTSTRVGKEQRYELLDHHVGHIVADALAHAAESDPASR